jgi:hypothetical protein
MGFIFKKNVVIYRELWGFTGIINEDIVSMRCRFSTELQLYQ